MRSAGAVADEMSLTRSAVSHMLRRLEDDLGFAVSEPDGRGIRLTVRGKRYAQEARRALDIMSRAAADEPALSGELKVVAPPGFAAFWLADRIGSFADQFPDITVSTWRRRGCWATSPMKQQMFRWPSVRKRSCAIRADLLAQVALFPVCAPSALSAEPGLRKASDLQRHAAAAPGHACGLAALAGGCRGRARLIRAAGWCSRTCRWCRWRQPRVTAWRWAMR